MDRYPRFSPRRRALGAFVSGAILAAAAGLPACAARADAQAGGDRMCPEGRVANYLVPEAQQCWYASAAGRWRTLSHELHYDVLVVQVEAERAAAGDEIARRFVEVHAGRFSEILIYVHPVPVGETSPVRRVRWTETSGFETLDFSAPAGAGIA